MSTWVAFPMASPGRNNSTFLRGPVTGTRYSISANSARLSKTGAAQPAYLSICAMILLTSASVERNLVWQ
jgi:hypothetical protein